jgi:hypothetical protein
MQDWTKKGDWETTIEGKTLPVEVSEEVYTRFLECLPPEEMGKTRSTFINLHLPVQQYFLVGEPYDHQNGKPVYATFCKALEKYWFIGYTQALRDL